MVPEIKLGLELLPEATAAAAKLSGAELSQATGRALFEEIGFGAPKGLTFFTHETSLGSLSHEIGISPETSGAVGNLTDSSGSAKAFLEAAEDSTKTYKVLSVDGKSPAASSVDWSLPKQAEDGTWTPGEWLNLHDTPENAYLLNTRPALHVSNVPQQWRLGQSNVRVFEAEIAPDDKLIWDKLQKGDRLTPSEQFRYGEIPVTLRDFPTNRVRLVRELGITPTE